MAGSSNIIWLPGETESEVEDVPDELVNVRKTSEEFDEFEAVPDEMVELSHGEFLNEVEIQIPHDSSLHKSQTASRDRLWQLNQLTTENLHTCEVINSNDFE